MKVSVLIENLKIYNPNLEVEIDISTPIKDVEFYKNKLLLNPKFRDIISLSCGHQVTINEPIYFIKNHAYATTKGRCLSLSSLCKNCAKTRNSKNKIMQITLLGNSIYEDEEFLKWTK